jgi:hypothetical protein
VTSISALLQIILESEMGGAKNQPVLLSRNFEKGGAAAAGTEPRPASQLSDRSSKGVDVRHFLWFISQFELQTKCKITQNAIKSTVLEDFSCQGF